MRQPNFATIVGFTKVLCLSIVFMLWIAPTAFAEPATPANLLFIPLVTNSPAPVLLTPFPTSCALNAQEQDIESRLRNQPGQERTTLQCNPILSAVARARAEDMGRRHYFDHVNPEQQGPNYLVRLASYVLPDEYGTARSSNNIESIGAGAREAEVMWNAWMESSKHRTHLLGQGDFHRAQTDYGIGFARVPGSDYQYYWVVITAKPAE